MLAKDLLLIDVETTGIDPSKDSIIQLAALILDRRNLSELDSFSIFIRPDTQISVQAFSIHGISEKDLADAKDLCAALDEFQAFAPSDALLSGHNVSFDMNFLKTGYAKCGLHFPFDYHTIDIWSIAFFVISAVGISLESYSLSDLANFFGVKRSVKHDALEDVRVSAIIARNLLQVISGNKKSFLERVKIYRGK